MKNKDNKLLIAIIVFAFLIRIIGVVPNIYHADESFVNSYSYELAKNIISKGDINPHTFKYGSFIFYLQATSYLPVFLFSYIVEIANSQISSNLSSSVMPFSFYYDDILFKIQDTLQLAGRSAVVLLGAASVWITYLIAGRAFNAKVALLSALILSISPLHLKDSRYVTTDVPSLLFILLSLLFFLKLLSGQKWKHFILTGFFIGFSSTVRYFPVSFVLIVLIFIFSFKKSKNWFSKYIILLIFCLLGVFLGLPYLFIAKDGFSLFYSDLQKYAIPWYGTSISDYIFKLFEYIISLGKTYLPSPEYLLPTSFKSYYFNYLLFIGYGILPLLTSVGGMIMLLFKDIKKFLFIFIIPFATFVYTCCYVPAMYERQLIPLIPFLAIFSAYFIYRTFNNKKKIFTILFVILILIQPLYSSITSSIACSKQVTQKMISSWINLNIPEYTKIALLPPVFFPSKEFKEVLTVEPKSDFSLEEIRKNGFDYFFLNSGRLDYERYWFLTSKFLPNKEKYMNNYYNLIFKEYLTRSRLLKRIQKPQMCDGDRVYFFEIQKKDDYQNKVLELSTGEWNIQRFDNTLSKVTKRGSDDSLKIYVQQKSVTGLSPRLMSGKIPVEPEKMYSFGLMAKLEENPVGGARIVARIDFYNGKRILGDNIVKLLSVFKYGFSSFYYDELALKIKGYDNPMLPGKVVALSERKNLNQDFQQIEISAKAPADVKYAVVSVSDVLGQDVDYVIQNIRFSLVE